jgi:hypothetical protein
MATSDAVPAMRDLVYNIFGFKEDKATWENGIERITKFLNVLEKHLADKSWLVGNTLTLADIIVFGTLKIVFAFVMGETERESCPCVSEWFEKMANLPLVTMVTGSNKMAETAWKCHGSDATVKVTVQAAEAEKAEAADDMDEDDLFGSDDEDNEASFDALCKAK